MVLAAEARHRLGHVADGRERAVERRPHGLGDRARRLGQRVREHADRRDRLADVVVELAGHALALGFEVLQHAAREASLDGLDLLPLGDVANDAEEVGGAAEVDAREAHLRRHVDAVATERPRFERRNRSVHRLLDHREEAFARELRVEVEKRHAEELGALVARQLRARSLT